METKDIKVVIYEPEILFWGVAAGFHGYAIEFINQYADCIYLNKRRIGKDLGYKVQLWKMGIKGIYVLYILWKWHQISKMY